MNKKIVGGVLGVIVLIIILSTFGTTSAGEIGVKTRFGKVSTTLNNGLYFKVPFIERVEKVDVQTQKEQTDASAASSDLQTVKATVAINYNVDSSSSYSTTRRDKLCSTSSSQ